jgi:hypothetical protein
VNGHQVADSQGIIEGAKLAGHLMRNFDAQAVFNMR